MLVRKALRSRPVRAILAVAGIATSTLLVLVLFAAYRSPQQSIAGYSAQPGIDLWVAPAGGDNIFRSTSYLPMEAVDAIRALPGVAQADPVVRTYVTVRKEKDGDRLTILALGWRAPDGLGGPPSFAEGRAPAAEDEVALDRAAALRLGAEVGGTVLVSGHEAKLVGLTRDTNLVASQFLFFDVASAGKASGLVKQTSFVAVKTTGDRFAAARAIEERLPRASAFTVEQFVDNNLREAAQGFLPVLNLIAVLGVSAAMVLVALLVQGMVEDRRADIAVLLAMGTRPVSLAGGVIVNVVGLVLAGAMLGAALSQLLEVAIERAVPMIELRFWVGDVAWVLAVFCGAGTLGALLPILRLARVDPLEAFRA